ncbi:hypothetical protein NLO413_0967 [Candidatus Neoehrlichia lotoris str. RAC413]|uniref:Uncharacterized protein n=2 Tax=Candidatus Neoehrlichia procyonis TaxID=467750 RepID=A0A0F3NNG8_9RICK|nr:hypothetical protein NLO413_0967 [Candidatus Neoehrlichia lotoris str. RAC413]
MLSSNDSVNVLEEDSSKLTDKAKTTIEPSVTSHVYDAQVENLGDILLASSSTLHSMSERKIAIVRDSYLKDEVVDQFGDESLNDSSTMVPMMEEVLPIVEKIQEICSDDTYESYCYNFVMLTLIECNNFNECLGEIYLSLKGFEYYYYQKRKYQEYELPAIPLFDQREEVYEILKDFHTLYHHSIKSQDVHKCIENLCKINANPFVSRLRIVRNRSFFKNVIEEFCNDGISGQYIDKFKNKVGQIFILSQYFKYLNDIKILDSDIYVCGDVYDYVKISVGSNGICVFGSNYGSIISGGGIINIKKNLYGTLESYNGTINIYGNNEGKIVGDNCTIFVFLQNTCNISNISGNVTIKNDNNGAISIKNGGCVVIEGNNYKSINCSKDRCKVTIYKNNYGIIQLKNSGNVDIKNANYGSINCENTYVGNVCKFDTNICDLYFSDQHDAYGYYDILSQKCCAIVNIGNNYGDITSENSAIICDQFSGKMKCKNSTLMINKIHCSSDAIFNCLNTEYITSKKQCIKAKNSTVIIKDDAHGLVLDGENTQFIILGSVDNCSITVKDVIGYIKRMQDSVLLLNNSYLNTNSIVKSKIHIMNSKLYVYSRDMCNRQDDIDVLRNSIAHLECTNDDLVTSDERDFGKLQCVSLKIQGKSLLKAYMSDYNTVMFIENKSQVMLQMAVGTQFYGEKFLLEIIVMIGGSIETLDSKVFVYYKSETSTEKALSSRAHMKWITLCKKIANSNGLSKDQVSMQRQAVLANYEREVRSLLNCGKIKGTGDSNRKCFFVLNNVSNEKTVSSKDSCVEEANTSKYVALQTDCKSLPSTSILKNGEEYKLLERSDDGNEIFSSRIPRNHNIAMLNDCASSIVSSDMVSEYSYSTITSDDTIDGIKKGDLKEKRLPAISTFDDNEEHNLSSNGNEIFSPNGSIGKVMLSHYSDSSVSSNSKGDNSLQESFVTQAKVVHCANGDNKRCNNKESEIFSFSASVIDNGGNREDNGKNALRYQCFSLDRHRAKSESYLDKVSYDRHVKREL